MKVSHFAVLLSAIFLISAFGGGATEAAAEPAQNEDAVTHLIIQFDVAEESLEDFLSIMTNINDGMAGEKGFMTARVYRRIDDSLAFTLVEAWETQEDHEEHFRRINESGDWKSILAMLTKDPEMSYNKKL